MAVSPVVNIPEVRTEEDAFAWYDGLAAVDVGSMLGRWRGRGVVTGHQMDGLLETVGWYGKHFIDAEHVHPLVFFKSDTRLFAVDPGRIAIGLLRYDIRKLVEFTGSIMPLLRPVLRTKHSKARLRMVENRGVVSAAMCYDQYPIIDHFRRVNADTVLGMMDQKGVPNPYFFLLERDDDTAWAMEYKHGA